MDYGLASSSKNGMADYNLGDFVYTFIQQLSQQPTRLEQSVRCLAKGQHVSRRSRGSN